MKETQENIPASKFKSPQTLFLQAQSCFCFFCFFSFLVLHSFSGVRTSKCPSGPCGLPNTAEESRFFSLKNIKTTPRNSFHKSCRRTGTRNRHPKTKSLSKNYQRGNQNPDSNLRARSSFRVEVCCGRLVPWQTCLKTQTAFGDQLHGKKVKLWREIKGEFSINNTFQRGRRPVGYQLCIYKTFQTPRSKRAAPQEVAPPSGIFVVEKREKKEGK